MCDFYTMKQPISCHEWSWHQFQRNKSKKETNQVSLPVYKVRIGTTTTGLQTSFVSEDTSLQHLSRLAFNYKLTMTTTWKLCFIFKHILPQRPTQVIQRDLFIRNILCCIFREAGWCHEVGWELGSTGFKFQLQHLFALLSCAYCIKVDIMMP